MTATAPLPRVSLASNGADNSPLPSPLPEAPPLDEAMVATALVELRRETSHRFDVTDAAIDRVRQVQIGQGDLANKRHDLVLGAIAGARSELNDLASTVRAGFAHHAQRDSQHDEGLEAARDTANAALSKARRADERTEALSWLGSLYQSKTARTVAAIAAGLVLAAPHIKAALVAVGILK